MVRSAFLSLLSRLRELQRSAGAAAAALSTQDGRWAVVSTSLTALVAGSVAWLAVAATPPASARAFEARRDASLPYEVFVKLANAKSEARPAPSDRNVVLAALRPTTEPAPGEGQETAAEPGELDIAIADEAIEDAAAETLPQFETRTLVMESGDTLSGLLADNGVPPEDANAVVTALRKVFNPRSLRAGQSLLATFGAVETVNTGEEPAPDLADADDEAEAVPAEEGPQPRLLALSFAPSIEREVSVQRVADGSYSAAELIKTLEARNHHAGATIDSSLYLAAMQAGIPAGVVVEMIRMFSYDVDFQRDVRPGDAFEVFFERYYTEDGEPAKDGNILFASMTLSGKNRALYRYTPSDDDVADYFDAKGQSAKSMLMKTPVDGARLTSRYGKRRHPVLGYTKMHKGVDFGAPTGTPIMAAGSGTVVEAGRKGSYGNYIRIRHGNGYETAYAHLSRYAGGIKKGTRVRQGQIIGYVGDTGRVTGPHLHYEILVNGTQVNPMNVKVATGRKLTGAELALFVDERARIDTLVASLPLERMLAEAGDLRTGEKQ